MDAKKKEIDQMIDCALIATQIACDALGRQDFIRCIFDEDSNHWNIEFEGGPVFTVAQEQALNCSWRIHHER